MIVFFKKYWKYLIIFCSIILVFTISFFAYSKDNKVEAKVNEKTEELSKKEEVKEITVSETVFVDVKGAVNAPGVYELDTDKRVIDAINLAGGLTDKADTINLNLSKKLTDEMYIVVYTKTELYNYKKNSEKTCPTFECICPDVNNDACITKNNNNTKNEDLGKISINNATKEQLMTLSGVGESKANAIISYRNENGMFKKIEDIKNVSGIGDSMYEKIKNNITL